MSTENAEQIDNGNAEAQPGDQAQLSQENGQTVSQQQLKAIQDELASLRAEQRGLQSSKDKDVDALKKRLDQLGVELTPEQKLQNRILNLEESLDQSPAQAKPIQAEQNAMAGNVAEVFEKYGISPNSPEAMAMAQKHNFNLLDIAVEIGELRAQPQKETSPAAITQQNGATVLPDLGKEYEAEVNAALGNPRMVQQIRAKYREKGLKI